MKFCDAGEFLGFFLCLFTGFDFGVMFSTGLAVFGAFGVVLVGRTVEQVGDTFGEKRDGRDGVFFVFCVFVGFKSGVKGVRDVPKVGEKFEEVFGASVESKRIGLSVINNFSGGTVGKEIVFRFLGDRRGIAVAI